MSFGVDSLAFLIAIVIICLALALRWWGIRFTQPYLSFTHVDDITSTQGWKGKFVNLPRWLLLTALGLFLLAFIDPYILVPRIPKAGDKPAIHQAPLKSPTEGLAIYLVLDQSGSMVENVTTMTPEGRRLTLPKIDFLKQVTQLFVQGDPRLDLSGRSNDLIGLITFARGATVLSPLTFDHNAILRQLGKLTVVQDRDQDGTSIGYALFKAENLIEATKHYARQLKEKGKPSYEIKSSVIILVTDGFQDPNPLDQGKRLRNLSLEEAAQYAKEKGIRLYIINVDPKLGADEYAPQRKQMERITELTGGKFYLVDYSTSLQRIYSEIDHLEKSALPQQEQHPGAVTKQYKRLQFYPFLVFLGVCFLFASVILDTVVLRRVP